jgi:hypothetical protein
MNALRSVSREHFHWLDGIVSRLSLDDRALAIDLSFAKISSDSKTHLLGLM